MPRPKNQPHVTLEMAVEQCRRNRREAAILESRNGPPKPVAPAPQPVSQPALMAGK